MITFLYAFLGGLLPALVWLFFWLKEDKKNPEPRLMIFLAFIGGMVAVFLALPAEEYVFKLYGLTEYTILLWAFIEEFLKYFLAYVLVLRSTNNNEPVDPVIYMITAALGFAALENTLFLIDPIMLGHTAQSLITGNLRFIGATLLHILASGTLGTLLGFAFYRARWIKQTATIFGLIIATALHTLFNLFIMNSDGSSVFLVFVSVWSGIIFLILLFERVKRVYLHN